MHLVLVRSPTAVLVPDRSRLAVQAYLKHAGRSSRVIDYNQPQRRSFQVRAPATVEIDPKRAEPYVRYRLARFADLASDAEPADALVYQITADSVRRAIKDGLKIDDIISYLSNGALGPVPADTLLRVRGWGGAYSPLRQAEVVAVQLPPGLTWPMLEDIPEVRAGLIRAASPMVGLVNPALFGALHDALAERGLTLLSGIADADGAVDSTGTDRRPKASPVDELRGIIESLANGHPRTLRSDLAMLAALVDSDPDGILV
jgi:hypothetical protein